MENEQLTFEFQERPTIKGFPELRWTGKRPYRSTQYYPAQLREQYGRSVNGWINKIFWGDNLQVMSHLLKEYRGKIQLIYIDPPFDSKADYKKKIEVKGMGKVETDSSSFEEKQYGDIWTNDEYLQFMYERLTLMRELLTEGGCIYVHCDWHKSHHIRMLLLELEILLMKLSGIMLIICKEMPQPLFLKSMIIFFSIQRRLSIIMSV